MLTSVSTVSLTDGTYDAICAGILAGRLQPCERLKINDLSTKLHVSPGAVREALSRLAAEGLVVLESRKGFSVAPICFDHLQDLTRLRIEVESTCLQSSIANGGGDWERLVQTAAQRLATASNQAEESGTYDSDEWADVHRDYHAALVDACDKPWLLRIRAILYAQSERYCRLTLADRTGRDIRAEHAELTVAVLTRDADGARRLLADHLHRTAEIALERQANLAPPVDANLALPVE
jgi:DNA-binding GntR family transcriptional regulator